jgi:branched-chain amino acid transport system ATP-binding protein
MAAILSTEQLSKRFGGIVATEDVNLEIPEGELRCIIGPNGAGKSTLFALLCGIQHLIWGGYSSKAGTRRASQPFQRVRLGVGLTFRLIAPITI